MSALKPSIFEEIRIVSREDESRTIDLRPGVVNVSLYENILQPTVVVSIDYSDTSAIEKDGKLVGAYQGLPILGGEKVFLRIKANTPWNRDVEFFTQPLYVRNVRNLVQKTKRQSFTLDLVSREAILNEYQFVEKIWNSGTPITTIATEVLEENLGLVTPDNKFIEPTLNTLGTSGRRLKPFSFMTELASKSIPQDATGRESGSAGYFFYQTRRQMNFRSVNSLVKQPSRFTFFFTEVNRNELNFKSGDSRFKSIDQKILSYEVLKGPDEIERGILGSLSTKRRYLDPITQVVIDTNYKDTDYSKMPTLGAVPFGQEKNILNIPEAFRDTKMIVSVLSRGSYFQGVDTELDSDKQLYESQRITRYTSIFSHQMQIQVPLCTSLHAGDVITVNIPNSSDEDVIEYDEAVSGDYLIKELCHSFGTDACYTSMKLIRDTNGRRRDSSSNRLLLQ